MRKEFLQPMRGGKTHPTWAGVIDMATGKGLKSLKTRVLQIPSPENGQLAVVMATAEYEDGRVFEDVGDCSPASTTPQLAAAALRLASTRAKGRVLRDSLNIGEALLEEIGQESDTHHPSRWTENPSPPGDVTPPYRPPSGLTETVVCAHIGCERVLSVNELKITRAREAAQLLKEPGPFCSRHLPDHTRLPS